MAADSLNGALADFPGDLALDEVSDGPFCVWSLVEDRTCKRLRYPVLAHDPEHQDLAAFLRRCATALVPRQLPVRGVRTEGSPVYPAPVRAVFGAVAHQIWESHRLKARTKAV